MRGGGREGVAAEFLTHLNSEEYLLPVSVSGPPTPTPATPPSLPCPPLSFPSPNTVLPRRPARTKSRGAASWLRRTLAAATTGQSNMKEEMRHLEDILRGLGEKGAHHGGVEVAAHVSG